MMKITYALQQKVIAKYKDIIEHQLCIMEAQRNHIQKLEHDLQQVKTLLGTRPKMVGYPLKSDQAHWQNLKH